VKQIEDAILQRIERGDSDKATLVILNHKNQAVAISSPVIVRDDCDWRMNASS